MYNRCVMAGYPEVKPRRKRGFLIHNRFAVFSWITGASFRMLSELSIIVLFMSSSPLAEAGRLRWPTTPATGELVFVTIEAYS